MRLINITHIKYYRYLFSVNDYFLCNQGKNDASINYYIQCTTNVNNQLNEFHTLLIDLTQNEKNIWDDIYYRTKSEITSFIKNQPVEHQVLKKLSDIELIKYIKLFNDFAKSKHIRKAESYRLKAYNKQGILMVSYIKYQQHFLCINFYRVTSQRATNLYSFTLKHTSISINNSMYGRSHRALHWLDILFFKRSKIHFYDFCGWYNGNTNLDLMNINKFKEQFTKYKVVEYSGVIYKNKLLLFLKKLK